MADLRKRLLLTCTMIFSLGICSATITTEYQNEEWEEITVRELQTRNRDYSYQVCTNAEDSCTVTILYNQWLSDLEEKNVLDSIALWGPKFEQSIKDIALQRKEVFGNIENINFKSFYKQNKNIPGRWFLVEYEEITWEEAHRRRLNIALEMARDEQEAIQAREEYDSYMTMLEECGAPGGSMVTWFGYTPDDIKESISQQKELEEDCELFQYCGSYLDRMDEQERNEYLVEKAKEVVLNFGPDYYREYGEPEISEVMVYNSDNMWREHNGKRFYTVTFRYDKTKESLEWDYAAFVEIWENDGQPKEVYFGNGAGLHFFKKPYSEQIREGITPDDIVRYQPAGERVVVVD